MFDSPERLVLGLLTGLVFGFLLQKGQVAKYRVIVGQFLLKDWTVVKIMATAVVTGAIGVYAMKQAGWVDLAIRPAAFGGVVLGGILFGIGMTVLGLCPGTCVAACGEGRRDALFGVLGMLLGAGIYVATYEAVQVVVKGMGDWGKVTLPALTNTSPWLWIAGMMIAGLLLASILDRGHKKALRETHAM